MAIAGRDFAGRFVSKVKATQYATGKLRGPKGQFVSPAKVKAEEKAIAKERLESRRGVKGRVEPKSVVEQKKALGVPLNQPLPPPPPSGPAPAINYPARQATPAPARIIQELKKAWGRKDIFSDFDRGIEPWYYIRVGKKVFTIQDEYYEGEDFIVDEIIAGFARGAYGEPDPYTTYEVTSPNDFDEFYHFSVGD